MKRIFERIMFMVIGALIAFFSYLIGTVDSVGVKADKASIEDATYIKKIECDVLLVRDSIQVGFVPPPGKNATEAEYTEWGKNFVNKPTIFIHTTDKLAGINVRRGFGNAVKIEVAPDNTIPAEKTGITIADNLLFRRLRANPKNDSNFHFRDLPFQSPE